MSGQWPVVGGHRPLANGGTLSAMPLRMWTYDLAREQVPTLDHLRRFCDLSLESGYNAIGLYLEHRFAYPSTPWAHGKGCLTPEMVQVLQGEYKDLQIVPFINLLGHFEGFLYTEFGRRYAEKLFQGMQACPSKPEFVELANRMLSDTISIFDSSIIHIGGDETDHLGACPVCRARVAEFEKEAGVDGKARLFGEHFGPLVAKVVEAGRRPGVWSDMILAHPQALKLIPKEALIFDWQYFQSCHATSRLFREEGYDVVYCPTLHVYNATWLHLPQSERNVTENAVDAVIDQAHGVCLTTWECGLFGNYETLLPAIRASGEILCHSEAMAATQMDGQTPKNSPTEEPVRYPDIASYKMERSAEFFLKAYLKEGETYEEWARLMGVELLDAGGPFEFGGIRSGLKCRLLLFSNPFLCWLHHREELCGPIGDKALSIFERGVAFAPDASARGVSDFAKGVILFVRYAEESHQFYAGGQSASAATALSPCRQVFENLTKIARSNNLRIGGSLADIERCIAAREHVERVMRRIRQYGDGSLGYTPSFEMITHPSFMPYDQGAWWLINDWARE